MNNSLKINLSQLSLALEWVRSCLAHVPLSPIEKNQVELALEEAIVNALMHAYGKEKGMVELSCIHTAQKITFELRDAGRPFNPLDYKFPDLDTPLQEREEGGLGILLMRAHLDELYYSRQGSENVLTLSKFL